LGVRSSLNIAGAAATAAAHGYCDGVIAAQKLDHPSVARLQEVYHSPDYVFMVMDLYGGESLNPSQKQRCNMSTVVFSSHVMYLNEPTQALSFFKFILDYSRRNLENCSSSCTCCQCDIWNQ
jgi:hypothetical protein